MDDLTPGERARTILACSTSALVTGGGTGPGALLRELSAEMVVLCTDPVARGLSAVPVEVEVADASPLATRERIRGRVRIAGRAVCAAGCDALHVHPSRVTLTDGGEPVDVDVADLVRVWPYRLDRYGLVLRLEYPTGHADQRLPFRAPLTAPHELSAGMTELIARARAHRLPCARPRSTGSVASVLRAAPAARRLCSPGPDDPSA
jgi:hypothetical protein